MGDGSSAKVNHEDTGSTVVARRQKISRRESMHHSLLLQHGGSLEDSAVDRSHLVDSPTRHDPIVIWGATVYLADGIWGTIGVQINARSNVIFFRTGHRLTGF